MLQRFGDHCWVDGGGGMKKVGKEVIEYNHNKTDNEKLVGILYRDCASRG
jgi:hypothetical protein